MNGNYQKQSSGSHNIPLPMNPTRSGALGYRKNVFMRLRKLLLTKKPAIAAIVVLILGLAVSATVPLLSPPADAASTIPYKINFQGRLTNAAGNTLADGLYNIKFRIMSAPSGGTNLFQEDYTRTGTDNRIQVTNGLFSVQFGTLTSLSTFDFTQISLYVEVELPTPATATCATNGCAVFTEGPFTPRQPIAASPYAFNADELDGVDGDLYARRDAANTFTLGDQAINRTSATAFQIQNTSGAGNLFIADTTNTKIGIGVVPLSGGDILQVTGSVNASVSLKAGANTSLSTTALTIGGTSVCTSTGCTAAASSGSYIQNQNASPQTSASFNIDGTGRAATFNATTGINTGASAGTQRIDASGNLLNIANITTTNSFTTNLTRTMPTVVGTEVDIGTYALSNGAGSFEASVTVPNGGFSVSKNYSFPIKYDQTTNTWVIVQPISDTGAYSGNDFTLEANMSGATLSLRLRRSAGTTAGTASIVIKHDGIAADVFTPSTATSAVAAPTTYLSSSIFTQAAGAASIQGSLTTTGTINSATISGGTFSGGNVSGGTLTASAVNSLNVSGTAISGTGALTVAAGGTNTNISVDGNGTGQVLVGGTSTGDILLGGGFAGSGCTLTNATGALQCASTMTVGSNTSLSTTTLTIGGVGVCTSAGCTASGATGLAKNAVDTSSFAVTAAGNLYTFTNSSSAVASGVLSLVNGTNTNSTLRVTASGNPSAGQALIFASNTNASPTGNLLDLQSGSSPTSVFSVTAAGNLVASGTIDGASLSGGTLSGGNVSGGTLTASAVNSLNVSGTAISGTGALTVAAGGTNTNISVDGNGTGQVLVGGTSTGDILLGGGFAGSGCTLTNATGALQCASTMTVGSNTSLSTTTLTIGGVGVCTSAGCTGTTTLQQAYTADADSADATLALTSADGNLIFQNPSSGGITSGAVLKVDQLSTGAVEGLRIESAGSGNLLTVRDTTATARDVLTIANGGSTTFRNQTDSTSAFQVQNAAAGVNIFNVDTTNSRASIGAVGTAAGQFYVSGKINGLTAVGTVAVGAGLQVARSIFTQGRYAYVANDDAASLSIYDTSNPAAPVLAGTVSTVANPTDVYVQDRYAYVLSNSILGIYDVSNPASPNATGQVTVPSGARGLYVQGRYVYVVGTSDVLTVYDIGNPAAPVLTGTVSTGLDPFDLIIQGRYAYVINNSSSTLTIYDIGSPSRPVLAGSVGVGTAPNGLAVQGRYAYVLNGSTDNTLGVYDIKNPTSPTFVTNVSVGDVLTSVVVQGRYLYASSTGGVYTYDISNPASPVLLAQDTSIASTQDISVQGRYLYNVAGAFNPTMKIYDIGGAYIQQLETGSIETNTLRVNRNVSIGGDASIQGGLSVSGSALFTGSLSAATLSVGGVELSKGIDWTSRNSAADNDWKSVTYGNGLFVAIADNGTGNRVMTSPDGINWTIRTSAADNGWYAVTYGNGLFVAVAYSGSGNLVMTSPDGINWTIRTSAANNEWVSVTYGNGLFVAVAQTGTGNRVMTSPDGINWTIRTSAANNSWRSVTYGNGLFVAVAYSGSGNRVMTSPDGINWTIRTSAADNNWYSVTYGNGLFVAVSSSGTGNRVMTSPNGTTWTIRTSASDASWDSVTYGNGLFVAVAYDGIVSQVMTSPDGINWTSRTSPTTNAWRSVTYGNGLFVAVSEDGTGNRVMTSGKTELTVVPANNTYQGGITVRGDLISDNLITAGANWTSRTSAPDNEWRSVAYGNGVFVAVAATGTGNRVMTSPDGVNWTSRTSAADDNWTTVAYGNGIFVAISGNAGAPMTSPDGITWTLRTTAASLTWRSVTYGNGMFVAVASSGTGNRVMTSPDGINWTSRTSAADNDWYSVTYGNGMFVAVAITGTGNRVMTSTNGTSWTIRTSAADNAWNSVTYGNGMFVAVASSGTGNRVMTSPDGISWTIRTSSANNGWLGVTYGNGLFVAVSNDGTGNRVMTSPDGINWAIRTSAADNSWDGIAYGNGMFVAVAITGTGNRVMTSGKTELTVTSYNNTFQGGTTVYGASLFKSDANSATGFQVQNAAGNGLLVVDTTSGTVKVTLGNTASTNAVCSSLANATGPTAGTAYELRDCNAAPAADYAEDYPVAPGIGYGDIVVTGTTMVNTYDTTDGNIDWGKLKGQVTQLVKSSSPYQVNTVGIVSDNHGDFTSAGHNIKPEDNPMPVALNGRVPVNIAVSSEPIQAGDYLTTSSEPGKATKATQSGFVIGKALGSWDPNSGETSVIVFVEPGYYNGPSITSVIQNGGMASLSGLSVSGTADFAELNVSGTATITTLTVTGSATINGDLVVLGLTQLQDLQVDGHIISGGDTPTVEVLAASGTSATVVVDGNDTSGTITLVAGSSNLTAGHLVKITFSKPFGKVPRVVLSGQDGLTLDAKIFPHSKSLTDFMLKTDQVVLPNTTYTLDYIILE